MSYIITIGSTFFLVVVFVVLTSIEKKRGKRFFSSIRTRIDARVSRTFYIFERIDWGAFFGHLFKLSLEKVAHDVVHGTLLVVRTIERTLTRTIRVLRERLAYRSETPQAPEGFELGKTIQRFRKNLKRDSTDTK